MQHVPNEREATSSSNVLTPRPFGSDLWLGFWAQTIQLFGTIFWTLCKTQQEIKLLCFLFDMFFKLLFIQFGERDGRRHGESSTSAMQLGKLVEKQI